MFSEDYLIRMIKQATAVLAKIIGFKRAGEYREALQSIDQTLELLIGMDVNLIRLLDDESLYQLLSKDNGLDLEKLEIIADLFQQEGDIHELQNKNEESFRCYLRSLNYFLMISFNSATSDTTEISQKIDDLYQKLEGIHFEEKTLWDLFCFFENSGNFARADHILSKLAGQNGAKSYVVEEIKSFYQRMIEKSPKELAAGGLTRAQIRKKLKEVNDAS